jgi:hypothetical protein
LSPLENGYGMGVWSGTMMFCRSRLDQEQAATDGEVFALFEEVASFVAGAEPHSVAVKSSL